MPGTSPAPLDLGLFSASRSASLVLDVAMMVVAVTFTVLGAFGLLAPALGVAFPLQPPMVPDAALAGLLAGVCFFSWLQGWRLAKWTAALPLMALCLYTLWHNAVAGGPWAEASWVSGGPRILSLAAVLLWLWALCCLLDTRRSVCRLVALASGLVMLLCGLAGIGWLVLPGNRLGWLQDFVSSPLIGITFALLGGLALLAAAYRGGAATLPLGWLSRLAAVGLLLLSCLGWYVLTANAQAALQRQAVTLLDTIELNAHRLMTQHINLLERFTLHSELSAVGEQNPQWSRDASILVERLGYLQGLAMLQADGSMEHLLGKNDEARRTLRRELQRPAVGEWLGLDLDAPRVMPLARVAPSALAVTLPVGRGGRQLVAWVNLADLLRRGLVVEVGGLRATVEGEAPFFTLRRPGLPALTANSPPMPHLAQRSVGLPGGGRVVLNAYADSPPMLLRAELMPASFALAGLILSFLLALSLGFNRMVNRSAEALQLLRRGIEASPSGVVLADARQHDMPLVYVNAAFAQLTGYSAEESLGRNCRFLQGRGTEVAELDRLRQAIREERGERVLIHNVRRDGTPFLNQLSISPVRNEKGHCTHFIGIQQDVTLEHEQAQRLAYQASHDLLTGLPNRSSLLDRLAHDAVLCQQRGLLLVVLYIDLDDFKSINDGLGHEVGNRVLVAVVERLRPLLDAGDTLARLVGDEFVMLLPGLEEDGRASLMAEQVLKALDVPLAVAGHRLHISASIGLASNRLALHRVEELLQYADLAMQEAKARGRNTWQWYRGDAVHASGERVALRHDLQQALREGQFELYYQPIVEASSGRQRSVEALLRWHHPIRGLVSPADFIPLAEHTGQIIELGRWVLQRACRDMATLEGAEGQALSVAVNISPLQFRREDFVGEVNQALVESGLAPERLELEMTEGVLLSGVEEAVEQLRQLRVLGVRVAIDDFGTGFSSLSYLRDLPIQKLKLDLTFVQQVLTSRDSAAIVQGIVTLAHQMELVVVAEGIETLEQRQALLGYQCDLLQGYLFSPPVPLSQLRHLPMTLPEPPPAR
ncbi:MAG: putative bifunctional diguanylate cyclase/phosphodiesterase [Pseudomonadota bacterium]